MTDNNESVRGRVVAWMLEYTEDGEVEREYNGHDQFSCGRTGGQPLVLQSDLAAAIARAEAAERDAARWREVSDKAWFVDAAATVYDLHCREYSWQVSRADEDDVRIAIDAAIAAQQAEGEDRG